jgi:hypothetical protein
MQKNIIITIITYFKEEWGTILLKAALAIGIFFIGYILIQWIVKRIRTRIEENSLEADIYTQRNSHLVGKMMFILLMIFLILAIFQVI